MSPILINTGTTNLTTTNPTVVPKKVKKLTSEVELTLEQSQVRSKSDEDTEEAREERKATGRSIAIIIFLSLMCLALYHVVQRKKTVLAGVLVPALILFTYTFFVIHISNRDKKRRKQLESSNDLELSVQSELKKMELHKKISTVSNPSISSASIPSTSGLSMSSSRNITTKHSMPKSSSLVKIDPKTVKVLIDPKGNPPIGVKKVPPPFKKAQSQSHIQVKSNQSAHISIEHETKKLKKSRSFDKNNYLVDPRHMIDNKKIKTKH